MNKERTKFRLAFNNRTKRMIGIVLLIIGFALLFISRISQRFADWYSAHIYSIGVNVIGRVMGILPVSASEVLLYMLLALLFAVVVRVIVVGRKDYIRQSVWNLFLLICVLFFLYVVNCGVNYYRATFSENAGIDASEYTMQDLAETCRWLTERVREDSANINRDEGQVMTLAHVNVEEESRRAMQRLGKKQPVLEGYYPKPKGLMFPWILSVQNLTGIYSPFTVEANYNTGITAYNIPFTACHELSHLRGFMEEKEANFIGFLACRESDVPEFRYSGSLMGWIYCMNVLYRTDYEAWEEIRSIFPKEAEADLRANNEYWEKYDTPVAEVSNKINDTYLKANGQSDGVESYDRMVDLIVSEYLAGAL